MALLLGSEIAMAALGRAHWLLPGLCASSMLIGYFWSAWHSARRAPKLTVFTGEVTANTESDMFTVPNFARRAYIVGCDDGTPGSLPAVTVAYLRFWQIPDGNAGTTNVGNFFVSANQPQPLTVPNAGMYFSVFNQSITMRYAVVFELTPS